MLQSLTLSPWRSGFFSILFIYWFERERERKGERERKRERERNIDMLFHLVMHSLVDSCMCSDQGWNPQPWHMGTWPWQNSFQKCSRALAGVAQLVGWSCKPKGLWFHSPSGHMPGLWVQSLDGVRARGNPSMFLSHSFSLLSPLFKINKYII